MHDLTSQQIVLLCLLVSFVTSIATGITTVSLLEQAPDPVAQTINRVVERTIEKIVPGDQESGDSENSVTTVTTPEKEIVTVVVREEDLTIEAVQKNSSSIVRIYSINTNKVETFAGLGLILDSSGRIITDKSIYNLYKKNLFARYNGVDYPLTYSKDAESPILAILNMTGIENVTLKPATFGESQKLQLAQSVISLSGKTDDTVSTGIITEFQKTDVGDTNAISGIMTSVNPANVINGSILINLQGSIVGMKISSHSATPTIFIPADVIQAFSSVGQS